MKKVLAVLVLGLLLVGSTSAQVKPKPNVAGLNPLGLIFGIYSGEYSRFMDDGATEIHVPFFYWNPITDLTVLGLGAQYRMYLDKNGNGIFYGGGVRFGSVSWKASYFDANTFQIKSETVSAIVFGPEGVAGYRWLWENGLTVAPSLTLGYNIGKVEDPTGGTPSTNPAGFQWGIGLGLGYNF